MEDIGEKLKNGGDRSSSASAFEEEQMPMGNEVHIKEEDDEMSFIKEEELEVHIKEEDDEMSFIKEEELEEAYFQQLDTKTEISIKNETMKIDDSMFSKLDELLNQSQLYTEFLLEKMDDITDKARTNDNAQVSRGRKRGRPTKQRKVANNVAHKGARAAVEAVLAGCKEDRLDEGSDILTDEERLWREQMELVPLMSGGRLKSYQMKGVKWMISLWQNGLNGILADQMGLGKTVQTIGLLAHLKGNELHGPFLVIAPLSTLSNWVNEFNRFVPTMNALLYHGSKEERAELRRMHMPITGGPSFPVVVTSYEIAMSDQQYFARYEWKYLVVDEGHRLKNFNCKLLKKLKLLKFDNTLLLTGTPLHNNLPELWSLLNFILPQIFTSLNEFESWFDLSGTQMNGTPQEGIEGKRRVQVISKLHAILRPFLLRRLKEDVEKDLPRKKEIILYARLTKHQKEIQEHLINKTLIPYLHENSSNGTRVHKTTLHNQMIQLRKNFNHPDLLQSQFELSFHYPPVEKLMEQCGKLQLLDRILKHLKARGHKVLIFSQWTRMLDMLEYCLTEAGHEMCRIDGSVKLADRQRQIKDFNDPTSSLSIFLLSTRAGGLGINLTAADTCIIYDSDWNPQMDLQAMDRCHRIGQTKAVHVYRLCTAHSVECRMLKVAFSKLKLEHVVIEQGKFYQEQSILNTLKESDLLALLHQERNEEEELVQSEEISEPNLLRLLDRSDMIHSSLKDVKAESKSFPLKGPGWEVVIGAGKVGNMLSAVEG